ncbi:MAG: PAS domain S-box protein [Candidatus Omnitrophica bacterium]|nr:PAS domain S-box protein [Candidatus Omnitrophota bacterium]
MKSNQTSSEERFRLVVEAAPNAMIMVNKEGKITLVNRQAESLFGYTREEFLNQTIELLVPERFRAKHPGYRDGFFHDPKTRPMGAGRDLFGLKKNGTEIPIEIGLNPIETKEGIFTLASIIDITERKKIHEQKARLMLSAIVESSDDAIFGKDLEGVITSWNHGAERLYGYTAKEAVGKSMAFLVPQDRKEEFFKTLEHIKRGERIEHYETQRRRKDGTLINISLTVSPIVDIDGRVLGASGIARDITERKRAERTIRSSEARYHAILKSALDGIISADIKGNIISWNEGAQAIFGYSDKEVLGKPLTLLMPERYRDPHQKGLEHFRRTGEGPVIGKVVELAGLRKDGSEFPLELSITTWKKEEEEEEEEEEETFLTAVVRDITERKRAQEKQAEFLKAVERSNQELNEFAYAVSHDLKAPLRGISSLAEWIGTDYSKKIGEEGQKQFGLLSNRVKRMNSLIDGILHYSRIERVQEEKESVDLNLLVWEVSDLLTPPKHIAIRIERPLPTLVFERAHLHQLFQNLLSNAVRFMDKPKGEIKVNCAGDGAYWRFGVQDNGAGIDTQYHERIFRLFETLAPHDETESTGIGLALVKKIVERAGGKVWVESQLGKGSTFFFTLPKDKT